MSIKKKKKNDQMHQPLSNVLFALLWALSYGLAWFMIHAAGIVQEYYVPAIMSELGYVETMSIYAVCFALASGVVGYMQQRLVKRQSGERFRYWWLVTGLASWLAYLFFFFVGIRDILNLWSLIEGLYDWFTYTGRMIFGFVYFFMPLAILQTFFLRNYVRYSWLWMVATLVGTLFFATFFPLPTESTPFFFASRLQALLMVTLAMTVYGLVMGVAMVWLLQHRTDSVPPPPATLHDSTG